jgi:hypothetical protein
MRALLSVEEADIIRDDAPIFPLRSVLLPLCAFKATSNKDPRSSPEIALAILCSGAPDLDPMPLSLLLLSLADRGRDREDAKLFARCGSLELWILAKATKKHHIINQGIPL